MKIFISYSRKDGDFARRLVDDLRQSGGDVWFDVDSIPAGTRWSKATQQGLQACDLLLLVISPDSMASDNVEDEWQYYLEKRKPIIPVLVEPTEIHFQLTRIQYIDFHSQVYDKAFKQLSGELGRKGFALVPNQARESSHVEIVTPHDAKPAEPVPGTRMTDDKGVTMVYVPAGKFLMGSTQQQVDETFEQAKKEWKDAKKEDYADQMPQHEQVIQYPFWLDLTPVTNESYARFVAEGGYRTRELWTPGGWIWVQNTKKTRPLDYVGFDAPHQPRTGVTWFESYAYCSWRSGRLPTESEWEWAARGPENRIYPWGNTFIADSIVYDKNSGSKSAVVGDGIRSKGASWIGALDMCGNVWEWCHSLYQGYPYNAIDGRESSNDTNKYRILRGGSWLNISCFCRSACRAWYLPDGEDTYSGFRCTRSF